jgi:hypothetical protein
MATDALPQDLRSESVSIAVKFRVILSFVALWLLALWKILPAYHREDSFFEATQLYLDIIPRHQAAFSDFVAEALGYSGIPLLLINLLVCAIIPKYRNSQTLWRVSERWSWGLMVVAAITMAKFLN